MIINRSTTVVNSIKIGRPLSYEYDSNSSSIVLQTGYIYNISYDGSTTKDIIDLRDNSTTGIESNE